MARTDGRADADLTRRLVDRAGPTVEWLTEHGVDWDMEPLAVGYTAARTWFDNDQLLNQLIGEIKSHGGEVFYETSARDLILDGT